MHDDARTLREYWSIADRPAISLEEVRSIVDARDERPEAAPTLSERVGRYRIPALGAAALVLLAIVLIAGGTSDVGVEERDLRVPATVGAPGPGEARSNARDLVNDSTTEVVSRPADDALPSRRPTGGGALFSPEAGKPTAALVEQSTRTAAPRSDAISSGTIEVVVPEAAEVLHDGSGAVELTTDELARIGVQSTDGGLVQFFWLYRTRPPGEDGRQKQPPIEVWSADARVGKVLRGDIGVDTVETFIRVDIDPRATVQYLTFSPELVTSATGRFLPMYYRFDLMMSGRGSVSDSDMAAISDRMNAKSLEQLGDSARLGRLIPVRVRGGGRDVIVWYSAHPRFLALLPRRVQESLRREIAARPVARGDDMQSKWTRQWMFNTLEALDSLLAASAALDDVRSRETGSCYFAACATASGALAMQGVVPSVVRIDGLVSIDVAARRTLRFALHSFDGREQRILASGIEAGPGELRQAVRFDGVESGMYLLVVTSDAGERVSSRVLVR